MTNRLIIKWNVDGLVSEQRYYCSETPIDTLNLPTPKVVLAGDIRTYTDDVNIETNKKYYVIVGTVKNDVEKLSEQISIVAVEADQMWSSVIALLNFKDGAYTDSTNNTWTRSGTTSIGSDHFSATGGYIQSSTSQLISLGNNAVTIEAFLSLNSFTVASALFSFVGAKNSTGRVFGLRIMSHNGTNYTARFEGGTGSSSEAVSWGSFDYIVEPNEKHHLAICIGAVSSNSRLVTVYVNGVQVFSASLPRATLSCSALTFGYAYWTQNWNFYGKIYSLRITKGVRYTAPFDPPFSFPIAV